MATRRFCDVCDEEVRQNSDMQKPGEEWLGEMCNYGMESSPSTLGTVHLNPATPVVAAAGGDSDLPDAKFHTYLAAGPADLCQSCYIRLLRAALDLLEENA